MLVYSKTKMCTASCCLLIFLFCILRCIFSLICDVNSGPWQGLKIRGACSTVVGIIWPPVEIVLTVLWKTGGLRPPPSPPLASFDIVHVTADCIHMFFIQNLLKEASYQVWIISYIEHQVIDTVKDFLIELGMKPHIYHTAGWDTIFSHIYLLER